MISYNNGHIWHIDFSTGHDGITINRDLVDLVTVYQCCQQIQIMEIYACDVRKTSGPEGVLNSEILLL